MMGITAIEATTGRPKQGYGVKPGQSNRYQLRVGENISAEGTIKDLAQYLGMTDNAVYITPRS